MPNDLNARQVYTAILSLLRVAATWLDAEKEGRSSEAANADAVLLDRVRRLLEAHQADTPLFRAGRNVIRRRDVAVVSAIESVIPVLKSVQKGTVTPVEAAVEVARVLRAVASSPVSPETVLENARDKPLAPSDGSGMKEWIRVKRGPVEAASALVQDLAARSRARRLLKGLDNGPAALSADDDKLVALTLEAKARGRVPGRIALVRTALLALGYSDSQAAEALPVLGFGKIAARIPTTKSGEVATVERSASQKRRRRSSSSSHPKPSRRR